MEKDISAVLSPLDRLEPTEDGKKRLSQEHAENTGKQELPNITQISRRKKLS
jgi:hypothetical protein